MIYIYRTTVTVYNENKRIRKQHVIKSLRYEKENIAKYIR